MTLLFVNGDRHATFNALKKILNNQTRVRYKTLHVFSFFGKGHLYIAIFGFPFIQVNTRTQGGNRKVFAIKLSREEKTLAIKHRQINASVSPFRQLNTLTHGGNRKVFEMNL